MTFFYVSFFKFRTVYMLGLSTTRKTLIKEVMIVAHIWIHFNTTPQTFLFLCTILQ